MNQRQREAIASRVKGVERQQVTDAGVDGAATPPKPKTTPTTPKPTSGATSAATAASSKTGSPPATPASPSQSNPASAASGSVTSDQAPASSPTSGAPSPDGSATSTPPPEYGNVKAFKKWAEQNPEAAVKFRAEIDGQVYREGEDPKQEWIRQTNRGRKLKEEIRAQRAELERISSEKESTVKANLELAERTAQGVRYLADMWGAASGKDANGQRVIDFDTVDEAFRQNANGLTFDEYSRLRARRGVSNPEAAKLRAENRRLELQLKQTNGAAAPATGSPPPESPAAAPAEPAKPAAPARNPEEFWADEVPKAHPLRKFAGWAKDLDTAMSQYHDDVLDEYSKDAEEIATELVQRKLAELRGPDEDDEPEAVAVAPHKRAKPKTPKNRGEKRVAPDNAPAVNVPGIGIAASKLQPRGAINTDRSHREGHYMGNEPPGAMSVSKAVERAQMRARGIDPDTGERLQ